MGHGGLPLRGVVRTPGAVGMELGARVSLELGHGAFYRPPQISCHRMGREDDQLGTAAATRGGGRAGGITVWGWHSIRLYDGVV